MSPVIYERPELYDQIYDEKDYEAEAADVMERLSERGVASGSRILEAACGTGQYLRWMECEYDVGGFDKNETMLGRASEVAAGADLFVADMQDFSVEEPYDAVVCLFSSIGYAEGLEGLRASMRCFAEALRPGGVVIIDPWVMEGQFMDGLASMQTYESAERKICRQCVAEREGRLSPMEFHWLVADEGEGVEHLMGTHELYVFSREEYEEALEHAGFEVEFDPDGLMGRGLFVGKKETGQKR